jgi:hypothetical protein
MSRVTLTWKGDEFARGLDKALNAGIDAATITATREMEKASSKVQPGVVRKVSKKTGRVYWKGRGAPKGGFPGKRSGQLTASMMHEPARGLRGRFGASVNYAGFVHKDRPFIALTMSRFARQIEDAFVRVAAKRLAEAAETPDEADAPGAQAEGAD